MQRILLSLVLLLLVGGGLALWLTSQEREAAEPLAGASLPSVESAGTVERALRSETSAASTPSAPVTVEPERGESGRRSLPAALPASSGFVRGNVFSAGNSQLKAGPLGGVEVRISLKLGDSIQELGSTTSGADGLYSFESRELAGLDEILPGPEVQVAFHAAGHQDASQRAVRDPRVAGTWQSSARLQLGANLVGRVLDGDGATVADAEVNYDLEIASSGPTPPLVRRGPRPTRTDAEGVFRVGVPAGRIKRVIARKLGRGSVEQELDLIVEASEVSVGDLQLTQLERLAGRVVYPDGSPARGLSLVAQQTVELEYTTSGLDRQPGVLSPVRGWSSRVRTDEQGEFAFEDLQPGRYTITEQDFDVMGIPQRGGGAERQVWGRPEQGGPYQTGRADLRLETQGARFGIELFSGEDPEARGMAWVTLVPRAQLDSTLDKLPPPTGTVVRLGQRFFVRVGTESAVSLIAWQCGRGGRKDALVIRELARNRPGEQELRIELSPPE